MIRDFAERICTGYTSVTRAQASIYPDCSNTLLGDARERVEYPSWYPVRV